MAAWLPPLQLPADLSTSTRSWLSWLDGLAKRKTKAAHRATHCVLRSSLPESFTALVDRRQPPTNCCTTHPPWKLLNLHANKSLEEAQRPSTSIYVHLPLKTAKWQTNLTCTLDVIGFFLFTHWLCMTFQINAVQKEILKRVRQLSHLFLSTKVASSLSN